MHSKLSRRARLRALALAVATAALIAVVAGAGAAGAAETGTGTTDVIKIELSGKQLKFVAPETVAKGDQLEIVNETNPKEVGPHTFSLVTKGSIPKTAKQRKNCFTPKHICLAIAMWHKFNPKTETIKVNPVDVGPKGWSTMGSLTKKGDSWFTGETPHTHISEEVSAEVGTTLYFQCAVHPWMHGSVKVVAPPAV